MGEEDNGRERPPSLRQALFHATRREWSPRFFWFRIVGAACAIYFDVNSTLGLIRLAEGYPANPSLGLPGAIIVGVLGLLFWSLAAVSSLWQAVTHRRSTLKAASPKQD